MNIKRSRKLVPCLASLVLISCLTEVSTNAMVNQTVKQGGNVTFECDVDFPRKTDIVWFHHTYKMNWTDPLLYNLNPNIINSFTPRDEPNILRLHSVQAKDQGWYTCSALNATARTRTSAYLNVLSKKSEDHDGEEKKDLLFMNPNLLGNHVNAHLGSTIFLYCPDTGDSTWTHNNTEMEHHTTDKVTYAEWFIQINDVISEDAGIYECTACDGSICIVSSTNVTVSKRKPIISDKFPQNQTVLTNSSTYLECRVVSDLEPYIVWLKYTQRNESIEKLEKVVPNFSNDQSMLSKDVVILDRDPNKPNILNFTKVSHEDEGWYTCVAASSLGQTVASAYLKVVDKLPSREGLQRSHHVTITAVAIVVVLLFLLGTIFVIYLMRNLKHEKLLKQRIDTIYQCTKIVTIYKPPPSTEGSSYDLQIPVIKIEKQCTTFTTSPSLDHNQGFNEYEFPLDSNWERPRSQLSLGSTLGEGAFGRVVMAQISPNSSDTTIVAVKMVKDEHTDADVISLVREMEVMKMIGNHTNILNLLGCCTQNGPLWVIVEYAAHGNLKDFLKKNRPLSSWDSYGLKHDIKYLDDKTHLAEKHLISFAFQIARGMEYLASRKCIHRDLAARNVLVAEDYIMKIADFGLARDIQDTDYYRKTTKGLLPIKWMALESLQEQYYDSQSDVWSYGILLWEIMTYGEQPYPNIMSAEELYSYLITGQRMKKPPGCSLNIYMLMRQCWHFDSTARPTFSEIVENLDKILQLTSNTTTTTNVEYVEMAMPEASSQPSDGESENETFQENPLAYQNTCLIENC